MAGDRILLIGDNPFQGVSHLSLERARMRSEESSTPERAAQVLKAALESGADGFLMSVSDVSLDMLKALRHDTNPLGIYAIVPYTFALVRSAVRLGGIPGLGQEVAKDIVRSRNWRAVRSAALGGALTDPGALFEAYLHYEVGHIRAAHGPSARLESLLVHEIVTDMALALDLDWMFRRLLGVARTYGVKPGLNTRNLPLLVEKLRRWNIPLDGMVFAAPFNAAGFQMAPTREACEATLATLSTSEVIGFSLLAAGYIGPEEAYEYAISHPNMKGVALGASRVEQARKTFSTFNQGFGRRRALAVPA